MAESGRGRDNKKLGSASSSRSSSHSYAESSASSCWTSVSMAYDRRHGINRQPTPGSNNSWSSSQISENRRGIAARELQSKIQEHANQAAAARYGNSLEREEAIKYLRTTWAQQCALEISSPAIIHQNVKDDPLQENDSLTPLDKVEVKLENGLGMEAERERIQAEKLDLEKEERRLEEELAKIMHGFQ